MKEFSYTIKVKNKTTQKSYNKLIDIARDYVNGKITRAQAENYACIWAEEKNHWDKSFLSTLENYIYKLKAKRWKKQQE